MITLLKTIVETITTFVEFAIHSIQSLLYLLAAIPRYLTFLAGTIAFLPSILIPFCSASIAVYVLYLVLNRQGSS